MSVHGLWYMMLTGLLGLVFLDISSRGLFSYGAAPAAVSIARKVELPYRSSAVQCPKKEIVDLKLANQLKSQSQEDEALLALFAGLCNGTYIEMGGLDGILYSNSYVFNKVFGWKGFLAELSPTSHEALVKNRPNELATPVNAAVCDKPQTLHFMNLADGAVNGIWEFADAQFRNFWWKNMTINDGIPVQCKPLNTILAESVPETNFFDFLSLDIEGAEFAVLSGFDFSKIGFGVIFIEEPHTPRKLWATRTLLEQRGYRFMHSQHRSSWFINKNFANIYDGLFGE